MSDLPSELNIDDLYPFECCAVRPRYQRHYDALRNGQSLDPVEITVVDDCYLVTNGCNRVKAARDFGLQTVSAKDRVSPPDRASMMGFEESLEHRRSNGQKGFVNYDIVDSDEERERRTREELGF